MVRAAAPDWAGLLARWDAQQARYNPDRERRFAAMFDLAAAGLPRRFVALDLGCGPGSLSARALDRFPGARMLAVDFDPVVLRIGREAVGRRGGRLAWIEADLRRTDWVDRLPVGRVDAAFSSTALHWLPLPALRRLYRTLATTIRPGGIFLNADHVPWGDPRLRRLASKVPRRPARGTGPCRGETWAEWWAAIARVPELADALRERGRRLPRHTGHDIEVSVEEHERALRRAGFRSVAVAWQDLENRVLLAIR